MNTARSRSRAHVVALVTLALAFVACGNPTAGETSPATGGPPLLAKGPGTDADAMARQAANLDRIASDLKVQVYQLEATSAQLSSMVQGAAGATFRTASARFRDAAIKQIQMLDELSQTVQQAGIQYDGGVPLRLGAGQRWDFGSIESAAQQIQRGVAAINAALDEGDAAVAGLADVWGGSASDAYHAVRQRWDVTANELRSSLAALASAVGAMTGAGDPGGPGLFD